MRGGHRLSSEVLERRLALDTDGLLSGDTATIVVTPSSDLYITQIANGDIWFDDNSSFLNHGTKNFSAASLASVQTLAITTGMLQRDADVKADGSPMVSAGSLTTSFALQDMYLTNASEMYGSFSCTQPDGTKTTWSFTSWDGNTTGGGISDIAALRLSSGYGYGGGQKYKTSRLNEPFTPAPTGYYVPQSISITNKTIGYEGSLISGATTVDVVWNQPLTQSQQPVLDRADYSQVVGWFEGDPVVGPGASSNRPASVNPTGAVFTLPSAANPGSLGVIPGTLQGKIVINGAALAYSTSRSSNQLIFAGAPTGAAANTSGGPLTVSGNYSPDGKVYLSFTSPSDPEPAQAPGLVTVSADYAVYATSSDAMSATVYAAHDIEKNFDVSLLSPGSTMNFDSPVTSRQAVDFKVSATNVNINSQVQTNATLRVGVNDNTGSAKPNGAVVRAARAIAEIVNGRVASVRPVVGFEGAGYSPDAPPTVVIGMPQSTSAQVKLSGINGVVDSISLTTRGVGYTVAPEVTISAPNDKKNGKQAVGVAEVVGGVVTRITMTEKGSGYTFTPIVTIAAPPPAQQGQPAAVPAKAAAIVRGAITSIAVSNGGFGYDDAAPPKVTIESENGGSGATATAKVANGVITEVIVNNGGQNYTFDSNTIISIEAPPKPALAEISKIDGSVREIAVVSPGRGYNVPPLVTIDAPDLPSGRRATAVAVIKDGAVVGFTVTDVGSGYSKAPFIQIARAPLGQASDAALPAYAEASISGPIREITVVDGGARYTSAPSVVIGGGDGTAAAHTEIDSNGKVTKVVVDQGGDLYTLDSLTTVTIAPPGGYVKPNAAAATAIVDDQGRIVRYQITNQGSGYGAVPSVSVDAAQAPIDAVSVTAVVDDSGVVTELTAPATPVLRIESQGSGYDSSTRVVIGRPAAADGKAATAVPVIDTEGKIVDIQITDPGSGYVLGETPTVTISATSSSAPAIASSYTATGYGYRAVPVVKVSPPTRGTGGQVATASAVLDPQGRVVSFNIISGGFGYTPDVPAAVFVAGVNQLAVTEDVQFNANVAASNYAIRVADDPTTAVDRGRLFVSKTSALARDFGATKAADLIHVEANQSDVVLLGRVFGTSQTYYMPSLRNSEDLSPYVLTTRSSTTGEQVGKVRGSTVQVLLANDAPTPGDDTAVAFNTVDLQTAITSLRVRAATRAGLPRRDPFPYDISIEETGDPATPGTPGTPAEAPNLSVDAVAASSFPINIKVGGQLSFTSALATAGDVNLTAEESFSLSAPLSTTLGSIRLSGTSVTVGNLLSVTKAAADDARQDIVVKASSGSILLAGDLSAVNGVQLEQSGNGKLSGGRVSGDSVEIRADGAVSLKTNVNTLRAAVKQTISISELNDMVVDSLTAGGLVTLTADGVDPALNRPALAGTLTDVGLLNVSAPNGSIDLKVNASTTITLAKAANMLAAGNVRIRSSGGSAKGDIVAFDAPLAGSGARRVRASTASQLQAVYDPKSPGLYASTISAATNGVFKVPGVSNLRMGDEVLVAGGVTRGATGTQSSNANGVYTITRLGSPTTPWLLTRSVRSDTASELPSNSYAAVSDGSLPSTVYQLTYAATAQSPFTKTPITVTQSSVVTNIGSDDPGDSVTFVVSSQTGGNLGAGSLGKMLVLAQANNTSLEPSNNTQKFDFRFASDVGTVQLTEELPRVQKPLLIDGQRRFTVPGGPTVSPKVFIDGSRITSTLNGEPVTALTTVNGIEFRGNGASGSTLTNLGMGGFTKGTAVTLNGVSGVLVNAVTLGTADSVVRQANKYGVLATGGGSGNTILGSTIAGSSQAGIRVEGSTAGTVLIGNTIGLRGIDNRVGIELAATGVNKIGGEPVSLAGIPVQLSATTARVVLPATVAINKIFLGETVTGTGIVSGTRVVSIDAATNSVTLSNSPIQSALTPISFSAPARNVVQYNLDGVVLSAGAVTIANTDVANNTFDGIRVTGGSHAIGTTTKAGSTSNAIFGNGRWGVSILSPATPSNVKITGNFFGATSLSLAATFNGAGNVGVNGAVAPPSLNYVAKPTTSVDGFGNQYGSSSTSSKPTTPATPGKPTTPAAKPPAKFPWRKR